MLKKIDTLELQNRNFDLILANDSETLPLTFRIKKKERVIIDEHEFSLNRFEDNILWNLFNKEYYAKICENYMPKCDKVLTVCSGIGNEYKEILGISPDIITNACEYLDIEPTVIGKTIQIVYHGAVNPSRRMDILFSASKLFKKEIHVFLRLINTGNQKYYKEIQRQIKQSTNITQIKAVEPNEISKANNQFDIGVFILPPTSKSYYYALPNKFFEYIQSRLAIVIGPSPEMAQIVTKYDLGVVAVDFEPDTIAKEINRLTPEKIMYYKNQCHKYAKELSSEYNRDKLINIINELLEN